MKVEKIQNSHIFAPTFCVKDGEEIVVSVPCELLERVKETNFENESVWDLLCDGYIEENPENEAKIREAFESLKKYEEEKKRRWSEFASKNLIMPQQKKFLTLQ